MRRQTFDDYVFRHEHDETAHSSERHMQNNDWSAVLVPIQRDIELLQRTVNEHTIKLASMTWEVRAFYGVAGAAGGVIGLVLAHSLGVPI